MASVSNEGERPPGRTALVSMTPSTQPNPDGGKPGLVICELAHLGKINLRGGTDMLPVIRNHTGCTTLPASNRVVSVGDRHIVWLGPDEFLLLCEAGTETHLHSQLTLDMDGLHAAVTNVTDSLCALSLRGAAVRQVLAKGCALDLHPSQFGAGDCAQSLLAHAAVTLIAGDGNRFTLICRTSFAPYVAEWLMDAGLEFGAAFKG
jgi:sarcosine oxidase subunit gamma